MYNICGIIYAALVQNKEGMRERKSLSRKTTKKKNKDSAVESSSEQMVNGKLTDNASIKI